MKFSLKNIINAVKTFFQEIKKEIREQHVVQPEPTEKEKQQAMARLMETKKSNIQQWKLKERFAQPKVLQKHVQRGFIQRQHGRDNRR